jgi:LacI family transcriptional regulator
VNLEEVARLAGVSRSTVSRVVNGDKRVSAAARARVEEVIRRHNYHPNAAARSLASRRTRILGLRIPNTSGVFVGYPYFSVLTQGVAEAAYAADYDLLLMLEDGRAPEAVARRHHRVARGRHVDGLVVASSVIGDPLVEVLQREGIPLVVLGRYPTNPAVSFVDIDNRAAARTAVAHLLGHGRRRVATLTGPAHLAHALDRTAGYADALAQAGIPYDPALVADGEFVQSGGYRAMREMLAALAQPPDALFAASDAIAAGALQALREAGLRVPEDVALIGFDGLEPYAATLPTLSTVVQPVAALGEATVQILLERIEHPDAPPACRWLPTRLLLRGSCGCAGGEEEVGVAVAAAAPAAVLAAAG